MLAGLRPADDSAHFAAPSAGAAAVVDLAGMAAEGPQSPAAEDADAMASSDEEDGGGAGGDAMDETDGPQPSAAGAQPQQQPRQAVQASLHAGEFCIGLPSLQPAICGSRLPVTPRSLIH